MKYLNQGTYRQDSRYLFDAITALLVHAVEHQPVREVFLDTFYKFYRKQSKLINTTIDDICEDEFTPFTLNKYYYDTILKMRNDKVQQQLDKFHKHMDQRGLLAVYASDLKAPVTDANTNEENAADDLNEKLKAYCKVARKRIVDVVVQQTLERHVVKHIGLYFRDLIKVDDAILDCLIESELTSAVARTLKIRSRSWSAVLWSFDARFYNAVQGGQIHC